MSSKRDPSSKRVPKHINDVECSIFAKTGTCDRALNGCCWFRHTPCQACGISIKTARACPQVCPWNERCKWGARRCHFQHIDFGQPDSLVGCHVVLKRRRKRAKQRNNWQDIMNYANNRNGIVERVDTSSKIMFIRLLPDLSTEALQAHVHVASGRADASHDEFALEEGMRAQRQPLVSATVRTILRIFAPPPEQVVQKVQAASSVFGSME